jgi:hypothetical protein
MKKRKKKKKKKKKKNSNSGSSRGFLLRRGNVGLARVLVAVYDAGPHGIATYKLLHQLGSTNHAKAFIKRAEKEGLIERRKGEPPAPGKFRLIHNIITAKGKQLLRSQLL